jgi:uncharacterized protein YkwD
MPRTRALLAGLVALIALTLLVPARAASSCPYADAPAGHASKHAMRLAVRCLINLERTSRGLPPLRQRAALTRSAQRWTARMVAGRFFSHGRDPGARIRAAGYRWHYAGENIATGFKTPRAVVQSWMASSDHCRNILDPHFADVGTGVVPHEVAGYKRGSTWTQDFALRRGHKPPSHNNRPQSGCPY